MLQVKYEYTDNKEVAQKWFNELPQTIAIDFEVCSKYTDEEKKEMESKLETETDWEQRRLLQQAIMSDGLFHHSLNVPYHLSIATTDVNSYVIILPNEDMRKFACNWLVESDKFLVIHNASYDLGVIKWYAGRLPKRFYDTLLSVKVLTNHTEKFKAPVALKELMKTIYGSWAIAKEDFNLKNMYNENAIKYNAIDAAACMHLYREILDSLNETSH